TDAGRVVADLGHVADVVEDLCLPVGELIGQFSMSSPLKFLRRGTALEPILPAGSEKCKPLFAALTAERPFATIPNRRTPPARRSVRSARPACPSRARATPGAGC